MRGCQIRFYNSITLQITRMPVVYDTVAPQIQTPISSDCDSGKKFLIKPASGFSTGVQAFKPGAKLLPSVSF